ncbi:MAG: hypothetical protein HQL01_08305 [Nitrospirae bacterium]|nr:hypothetical protein [Nitrospirota bacterium]
MVKFDEITSIVSSFLGKVFGPETKWPDIVDDVRNKGLKLAEVVQSSFDTTLNTMLQQCEKSDGSPENPDTKSQAAKQPETSEEAKAQTPRAATPQKKATAQAATAPLQQAKEEIIDAPPAVKVKPPVRKPRAKKDITSEPASTKSSITQQAKTRGSKSPGVKAKGTKTPRTTKKT